MLQALCCEIWRVPREKRDGFADDRHPPTPRGKYMSFFLIYYGKGAPGAQPTHSVARGFFRRVPLAVVGGLFRGCASGLGLVGSVVRPVRCPLLVLDSIGTVGLWGVLVNRWW